jgi:hypothetical protein
VTVRGGRRPEEGRARRASAIKKPKKPEQGSDRALTVQEAARLARVQPMTIELWLSIGRIRDLSRESIELVLKGMVKDGDDEDFRRRRFQRLAEPYQSELVKKANSRDVDAGRALLQSAMVALDDVLAGKEALQADRVTLRHLHTCLNSYLVDGKPLDRAFCVERAAGGPKKSSRPLEDTLLFSEVSRELDKQKKRGQSSLSVRDAQKRVASKRGCSEGTVRAAWERCGALKAYLKNQKE